jgi:hypothetical protein
MYTETDNKVLETYDGTPESVEAIAEQLQKSKRSVIAKLAKMGVYQTKPKTTKTGDPIISKLELVAEIENILDRQFPTLVKAGKEDLRILVEALS